MRILLVDDSAAYREEFGMLLRDSGTEFSALDVASTVEEAIPLIKANMHNIYFIDYRLPGNSGLTLVRSARAAGVMKPIIMLTGYDHPEVDAAAEAAGTNDYLRKGDFTPETLSRAIRYAVRNAASTEAAKIIELRFTMAQEAANIGTWEWNIGPNTFIWSARQYANFGLNPNTSTADPVTYDTWRSAIHPADREHVDAALASAIPSHAPFTVKFRVVKTEGKSLPGLHVHWVSAMGQAIRDGRGLPTQIVGVSIDITEQQNALNAVQDSRNLAMAGLQVSEARFKAYFDGAPECLFLMRVTPDRRFVYEAINPAGLRYVGGRGLDAIRDRTPEEVLGPENGRIMTQGLLRVLETGSPYLYEPTFHMGADSIVYDAIYMPLFDDQGAVVAILGNARDVTEKRRLEASLRQSQKMEALGQLASGVAHDFNNLLQGMLGCLDMLTRQVSSEKGKTLIAEGRRTVERGVNLTNRLLAFSRQQPMTTQPVDLNSSIEEMGGLLTRTLEGVRVAKILAPDLWLSMADCNQIELAVLNLAINARDAMPAGGSFTIETSNERLSRLQGDGLTPGDYVSIKLSDTGSGMPAEVVARAFDPFFTTKPEGKGTGLGLSMVYGMVRQLGGGLRIASQVGKGTAVTILLPRADTGTGTPSAIVSVDTPQSASILLVEDDPDTQAAVRAYAADLGLSILVTESGQDALS